MKRGNPRTGQVSPLLLKAADGFTWKATLSIGRLKLFLEPGRHFTTRSSRDRSLERAVRALEDCHDYTIVFSRIVAREPG